MNDLEQFRQTYITECVELLEDMEERLLALDVEHVDAEQVNAIFRCAHTIKGGSGAFGLDYITHFTHILETLLDFMRQGKIRMTRDVVDTLLKSVDIMSKMVAAAKDGIAPAPDLGAEVAAKLKIISDAGDTAPVVAENKAVDTAASASESRYSIVFSPHIGLFASGNEPLMILDELSSLGKAHITAHMENIPVLNMLDPVECHMRWSIELVTVKPKASIQEVFEFVEDHCDLTITQIAQSPAILTVKTPKEAPLQETAPAKSSAATSIRVDIEKIDRLVNMVGELVITEAMLKAQTHELPAEKFAVLLRGIEDLSQHTRELQEAVMSVRMQPVKSIFSRMPRIVHDISAQLGKDIRLVTSGENTEVDKTVIEQLGDPLMHMIRNSVDHGIEAPARREQLGKPAQGTIFLSAFHRGGRIILEIRDDGAGINREKVFNKAREKGLVDANASLTDEEIDNIIFLAGFSTADTISNVSGRGVGMDVVKRNIESIGGTVRVVTEPLKGSVFTVSLPLTLAILDGMIVKVGGEHYIIPIISIIETLRPKAEEVRWVEGRGEVINIRGNFVPLVHLSRIFDIKGAAADLKQALVILVESEQHKMALVVDELIGQQQVVIKSLETNTEAVKGISGATILGDGRVALILEISELEHLKTLHAPHLRVA